MDWLKRISGITIVCAVFLGACTANDAWRVAMSDDPEAAVKRIVDMKERRYRNNYKAIQRDLELAKSNFDKMLEVFQKDVGEKWGKKETRVADRKHVVKYVQNYRSRAIVDFDNGGIVVETVDAENPHRSLENAIVTTLLTPNDPRSVDLFSDREVELSGKPYLYNLVFDHENKPIATEEQARDFSQILLSNMKKRKIRTEEGMKEVNYVEFKMVNDYVDRRVADIREYVEEFSESYGISKSLIYAVIKTESNFNPLATSWVPAYGLMQLVPASGGREAYSTIKGIDKAPDVEYLYDERNNIELGTAYLSILRDRYFSDVRDPVAREYCQISAYNTGAGNVYRSFSGNMKSGPAISKINGMSALEVYNYLKENLPHEETRKYLPKVVNSRKDFSML